MSGHDRLLIYFALACMWIGGYATGRGRWVHALVNWADWQVVYAHRRTLCFWIAVPIVLAAAAGLWLRRPRRTLANYRAWRARR
ncbi:hypothetical protein [Streptomyces sp. NPDC006334]|uniref:hypothetical protein n=1 Tax=Streptomyces sp. NPDC006334 TaxID=3156754 RepID=UPI0033A47A6B